MLNFFAVCLKILWPSLEKKLLRKPTCWKNYCSSSRSLGAPFWWTPTSNHWWPWWLLSDRTDAMRKRETFLYPGGNSWDFESWRLSVMHVHWKEKKVFMHYQTSTSKVDTFWELPSHSNMIILPRISTFIEEHFADDKIFGPIHVLRHTITSIAKLISYILTLTRKGRQNNNWKVDFLFEISHPFFVQIDGD